MLKKDSDAYRMIRATFPYLVFISVFIVSMIGVMWWANGAVPTGRASTAPHATGSNAAPQTDQRTVEDLLAALVSTEPGVALDAIRAASDLGAEAIDALDPLLTDPDPRTARLAGLAMDSAVYGTDDPLPVANALFRLLARCMDDPALSDAVRRETCGQILAWIAVVASDEHVPALQALFREPMLAPSAVAVVAAIPGGVAMDALVAALDSAYPVELRMIAARLLGERSESAAIRPLMVASAGEPTPLGWVCMEALAKNGVIPSKVFVLPPTATPEESRRYAHAVLTSVRTITQQGREDDAERLLSGLLRQDAPAVIHRAALLSMSRLEKPEILGVALGRINTPKVRAAAIQALVNARTPELDSRLARAYEQGAPPMQAALLQVLWRREAPERARFMENALNADDPELRATAHWLRDERPDEADLFTLAKHGNPWVGRRALGDYLALAEERLQGGNAEDASAQYKAILDGPFAEEDRAAALYGLARTGREEDWPAIEACLDEPGLRDTAWVLLTRSFVAATDREVGQMNLARVYNKAATASEQALVAASLETLGTTVDQVTRKHGYPTEWQILGPLPNVDGAAFGKPFYPPARKKAGPVIINGNRLEWDYVETRGIPAMIDLTETWGNDVDIACYALTDVIVSEDTPAVLRVLSEDPFECWVNGAVLGTRETHQDSGAAPTELSTTLQKGENRILIKTLRTEEPWQLALQLLHTDGAELHVYHPRQ